MRAAYLAGRWYPGEAIACREAIDRHSSGVASGGTAVRGLIGPHAGWLFSGDCAGRAYRTLAGGAPADIEVVVVFGSHRGPSGPNTVFRGEAWDTPLGRLETKRDLADEVAATLPFTDEPVVPARPDNGAEVHLPFVRAFFPDAKMLMVGVEASSRAIHYGRVIGALTRDAGCQAVFVGSTDLTHYGPAYGWVPHGAEPDSAKWVREQNDRGFLDALLADELERAVRHATDARSACCPGAAVAAMEATRAYAGSIAPRLVDHYLSYDVRPDTSFVGYGSLVF